MIKNWPAFIGGMMVALAIVWAGSAYFTGKPPASSPPLSSAVRAPTGASDATVSPSDPVPGAVSIRALPTLYVLRGQDVPFQGRAEIPLDLAGRLAQEIVVVSFRADGENARKSVVKVAWEDGSVETIPAGAKDIVLSPQRRAKKITVHGYSFYEQRVFKDVAKKGTLSWEIRYAPAEQSRP